MCSLACPELAPSRGVLPPCLEPGPEVSRREAAVDLVGSGMQAGTGQQIRDTLATQHGAD